ncbi:response regulator [Stenomitos frigidus]|uniref:histidine kinase n=1 Tax=Stenomitos frigidus ULC18 TaxID=2107698 RepID=A0A2T1DT95_9CYAN|nr:response regulator [Stenomitos frigidus]PSB23729.1 hybrid sensor histidine kinase/response regulator [Stenomitos frigidus ULC18]
MSIPEIDFSQSFEALAEEQLQQELRGLFAVDTQNYLQRYSQIAQSLQAPSWRSDIQELYRCVHTIKGGAVTIGAEAVLYVATALEDVLADLRYLEQAPSLADDHLSQALIEAGELLTGSLEPQQAENQEPILRRIQVLHQDIRRRYLPQWDEISQLHQEFAEEGLDLVVLELDIALERLPEQGSIPDGTFHTAQQILKQLAQIGEELQLAAGWSELLQHAQPLLDCRDSAVWRSQWALLFQALKTCAKQGGKSVPSEFASFEPTNAQPAKIQLAEAQLSNPQTVAFDANAHHDWGEASAALDTQAFAHSDLQGTETLLDYFEPTDAIANFDTFLDTFPVAETTATEAVEWLVEPSLDDGVLNDGVLQASVDPQLDDDRPINESSPKESSLIDDHIDDHQALDAVLPPNNEAEQTAAEPDQDWLVSTFLDVLTPFEATPVPQVVDFLDNSFSLDDSTFFAGNDQRLDDNSLADKHGELEPPPEPKPRTLYPLDAEQVQDWLDPTIPSNGSVASSSSMQGQSEAVNGAQSLHPASVANKNLPPRADRANDTLGKVQIPVPLETLDQSAQHLVETLLALRTTQGFYQALQSQITQIMALAQEGTQYITHLRQIQDDYTLLEELSHSTQANAGPTPERYRQGYTVINRLLETSLRLSEIGAETGKTTQQISDYLQNVDRNVLRLQSTIEDSRLVPFQNLSFRAKAILRDLTTRYNKPAQLLVQGEKTELDVTIARNLEPALLHLIRNAYDHGLESPDERAAKGKPEQGTITLSLQRQGNRFQFEIHDDGRGIDAHAIQARAQALHLPLCKAQTPADLLAVLCQPGFSAQNQVSEISGRGVGMDVVAAQVARLGGRLSLSTEPGSGTTFQLQFPVPRLLVPCVLLQAGDQIVAIPEDDIRNITLLSDLSVSPVEDANHAYAWTIHNEAGSLPALDLLKYWQSRSIDRTLADTTVCLYIAVEGSQQGVWLMADELLEQAELIINPIPLPLTTPNGLIGVSLQPNGALVPVLEARTVIEQLLTVPEPKTTTDPIAPSEPNDWNPDYQTQSILIVDDAALMRRRLEASLHSCGYVTHTCADGQEAWNWLQANPHPNLVITDIEMPNMDGFTLVDRCRQAAIDVPILVVSSRLSEEWFDEARRLGANDYLTKGFSTVELLKKVNTLLNLAVPSREPEKTMR